MPEPIEAFLTAFSNEAAIYFLSRMAINTVSIFILIRFIFYPNNGNRDLLITYFLIGIMVFLISSILDNVSLEFGFALGLFAIFGIIRFRTSVMAYKEMTYLFMVIGLSIINALIDSELNNAFSLFIGNISVLVAAAFMEWYKPKKLILKKTLVFKPSDLSVLNNNKQLIDEIKKATKIDVFKVDIQKVNATKKEVELTMFYVLKNNPTDLQEMNS